MKKSFYILSFILLNISYSFSQNCLVAVCNDQTLLSLDLNGEAELHYSVIYEGDEEACEEEVDFSIQLEDWDGNVILPYAETLSITCEHIGSYLIILKVTDGTVENFCWGTLNVQDNIMACGQDVGEGNWPLALHSQNLNGLIQADIDLNSSSLTQVYNWLYAIPEDDIQAGTNTINFVANINAPELGVMLTTLDLVIAQKIFFDLELDNPMQAVAMDVDGNGSLGVNDLVLARRFILGALTEFPSPPYHFVPVDFDFGDFDPFDFDYNFQTYEFDGTTAESDDFQFNVYSVGNISDIDEFRNSESTVRSNQKVSVENKFVKAGEIVDIQIELVNPGDFRAFQMGLVSEYFDILELKSDYSSTDFLFHQSSKNQINLLFNPSETAQKFSATLRILAKETAYVEDMIQLNEEFTQQFVSSDLKTKRFDLIFEDTNSASPLPTVWPNPSNDGFFINLPYENASMLQLYNQNGQLILEQNEGAKSIARIEKSNLPGNGFFILRIQNNGLSHAIKLIVQ